MTPYTVYVTPTALHEIKELPGHIRQRVKRAIDQLADNPYPLDGRELEVPDLELKAYRLRLDRWRIVYVLSETERTVDVIAVRKRPPYDYGDLEKLLAGN